jgi:23S rRNA pseudouridine2604 synthase
MMNNNSTRLNKYISESGICSRREADRYIQSGNVLINGRKAKVTDQVFAGDKVMVNGHALEPKIAEDNIYIAFNKPVGVTTTSEATTKDNIVDYVNHSSRIFPIGRLDKDSQGLIFLTNNGDIVNKILRASNNHQKEYLVTVNKPLTDQFIEAMSSGVPILGATTKKCVVTKETPFIFKIILIQGMNRQIRRMCEYLGYEVTKLERIRIMNVSLKGIALGDWRELTEEELKGIFKLIKDSSSDADDFKPRQNSERKRNDRWDDKPKKKSEGTLVRHQRGQRSSSTSKTNSNNRPAKSNGRNKNSKGKTEHRTERRGRNRF